MSDTENHNELSTEINNYRYYLHLCYGFWVLMTGYDDEIFRCMLVVDESQGEKEEKSPPVCDLCIHAASLTNRIISFSFSRSTSQSR